MPSIQTVSGRIDSQRLGVTLTHEHIFIDMMQEDRLSGLLYDEELALSELQKGVASGCQTIVDCTSIGLGRNPTQIRRMSEQTGLNIVMGTGYYRDPYLDHQLVDKITHKDLAQLIVAEISDGAEGTGIKPGVIGEVGGNRPWLSAAEERALRAAGLAQLQTGLTITTHAGRWESLGLAELDILTEVGVDPRRIIMGHSDTVLDTKYHLALAEAGVYVQFDTFIFAKQLDEGLANRLRYIENLVRSGYSDRILLSHDVCRLDHLSVMGGPGYAYLLTTVREAIEATDWGRDLFEQIFVVNPAMALCV